MPLSNEKAWKCWRNSQKIGTNARYENRTHAREYNLPEFGALKLLNLKLKGHSTVSMGTIYTFTSALCSPKITLLITSYANLAMSI